MQIGKRWWRQLVLILGSMLFAAPSEAAGPLGPGGPAPIPTAPAPQAPKTTTPQITPAPAITNPGGALFQHGGNSSTGNTRADNTDTIIGGGGSGLENRDTVTPFSQAGENGGTVAGGTDSGQKVGIGDTIIGGAGTSRAKDTIRAGNSNETLSLKSDTMGGNSDTIMSGSGNDMRTGTQRTPSGAKDTIQGGGDVGDAVQSESRGAGIPVTGSGFKGSFTATGGSTPTR